MAGPTAQLQDEQDGAEHRRATRWRSARRRGCRRLEEHAAGERVPAVGGEVGEVTGADQAVAAEQRVDRDRREDHRERRQRSRQGARRSAASGSVASKRDPARQRDVVADRRRRQVRAARRGAAGRHQSDGRGTAAGRPGRAPRREGVQQAARADLRRTSSRARFFGVHGNTISVGESARRRKSLEGPGRCRRTQHGSRSCTPPDPGRPRADRWFAPGGRYPVQPDFLNVKCTPESGQSAVTSISRKSATSESHRSDTNLTWSGCSL